MGPVARITQTSASPPLRRTKAIMPPFGEKTGLVSSALRALVSRRWCPERFATQMSAPAGTGRRPEREKAILPGFPGKAAGGGSRGEDDASAARAADSCAIPWENTSPNGGLRRMRPGCGS